jgi:hypothetical protein
MALEVATAGNETLQRALVQLYAQQQAGRNHAAAKLK